MEKKEPIPVQVLTFQLPLGTTGRLDEPQERYLIESVHQYRAAIRKTSQVKSVEDRLRNGEKLLIRWNGGWYPYNENVVVLKAETTMIER